MSFANNIYNTLDAANGVSFTPALTFGGGSTGIAYSSRFGNYHRFGNVVFFKLGIFLSNKGSSTGQAKITSLPFNSTGNTHVFFTAISAISFPATYNTIYTQTESGTTNLFIYSTGDNVTVGTVTDANFVNTSQILVNGFYFV